MNNPIETLLTCPWCEKRISAPVLTPCGETICGKHEEDFRETRGSQSLLQPLACKICQKDHKLNDEEHFPTNKIVQVMLEKEFVKLDLGELFADSSKCAESLKESIQEYERIKQNPEELLFDFFHETRGIIDLRREQIIQIAHECSERVLKNVDSYENECKSNLAKLNDSDDILQIKSKLAEWCEKVEGFVFDKDFFKSIISESKEHQDVLNKSIKSFKQEVFLGEARQQEFAMDMLREIGQRVDSIQKSVERKSLKSKLSPSTVLVATPNVTQIKQEFAACTQNQQPPQTQYQQPMRGVF